MKKYKRDAAAVQSDILRRPYERIFPLFLLPMVAAFSIGFIWPFLQGLFLSFTKFKTTSKWTWVGIDNYVKAFADESFRYSFGYTALYAIVSVILINVLAFAVAYALTQKIKGANLFRTVFFMPNLIGGIVLGYIWSMIFDGLLSNYGKSILTDSTWGFWGLIILMCWQQIGYMMIIYIAGLQAVPEYMLEAAQIDGCTDAQFFFRFVLPLSKAVMAVITLYYAVSHWNAYFHAFLYLNKRDLYPLQIFLREILIMNSVDTEMVMDTQMQEAMQGMADLLKYSLIVVSTAPILCIYPFLQRYFIKGVMIGSLKG